MTKQFVVGLDGSALAEAALPMAATFARAPGGTFVLVRVVNADEPVGHGAAEYHLATVACGLREEGDEVENFVRHGEAVPALIAEASARRAQLILLATHGRSGLGRWINGSVADAPSPGSGAARPVPTAVSVAVLSTPFGASPFSPPFCTPISPHSCHAGDRPARRVAPSPGAGRPDRAPGQEAGPYHPAGSAWRARAPTALPAISARRSRRTTRAWEWARRARTGRSPPSATAWSRRAGRTWRRSGKPSA